MTNDDGKKSRTWTKKTKIILSTIIAALISIAGASGAYYFNITIHDNQINTGSIVITDSSNVKIFTNIGNLQLNQNPIQENVLQDGEHGNSYTDKKAGFTIEKPSPNWYFMKVEDYVKKHGFDTINEYYLGGIFVATDKPASVMIVVQKLPSEEFDLSKYVDEQISTGSKNTIGKESTLVKKFVSPDGNWAAFEGYADLTAREYGRQILHKYNDRLYLIQTTGDPPNIMTDETKNELKHIIESFRTID